MELTWAVKLTWAKRCDVTLYISSETNPSFPTIGMNVPSGKNHISVKAKAAWKYIYEHHFYDADFFLKADPDTYVIVENMKMYLKTFDTSNAQYFGHSMPYMMEKRKYVYMSGGSGLVVSKEALHRLVTQAFTRTKDCMPDGEGTVWKAFS